jgi:calmodulin
MCLCSLLLYLLTRALLQIFDSNGDGVIQSDELRHVMFLLGNTAITEAEAAQIIEAADENGDGQIDFQEFQTLMRLGLGQKVAGS